MNLTLVNSDKICLIDNEDFDKVTSLGPWRVTEGYAVRCGSNENGISFMHHVILGPCLESHECHHKNDNRLDNRKTNLVYLTKARHRQLRTTNPKSGFHGVGFHPQTGKWRAKITKDGKLHSLGLHHNVEDAARAYDRGAISLYGLEAVLNFP